MRKCFIMILGILALSGYARADARQTTTIVPPPYTAIETNRHTCTDVSMTGPDGSLHVPSAFVQPGAAGVALYNAYTYQTSMLGTGDTLKNDTLYGVISYAPVRYLDVSIGSLYSSSKVNASQTLNYSGDLRIGIKTGYNILPQLSVGGIGEILTYSKAGSAGYAGYNGNATSYTLSLLASYDMLDSSLSFPLIANLRLGYLWDNTLKLISSSDNIFIPPAGKYAMGIRGDNRTLLACSLLFPLPRYYIEPMLEFTSEFANQYSSYAVNDPSFANVSFSQNPLYLTPGIIFYTPVNGLRITVAAELSLSKKLDQTSGSVFVTPQTVWIAGISYRI
ncbi:MAG: hypothetical protein M1428_04315 [Deltaproteobacteria bacterium]|nr:hypothetical protein [Deltaproteobacteria bacterium]